MTDAPLRPPPTDDPRIWDAIVTVGTVVLLVIACFAGDPMGIALGVTGVLLISGAYLAFGRRVLRTEQPSVAFQLVAITGAAIAAYGFGPLGAAQGLAAPLIWLASVTSFRRAVIANLGLFAAVLAAFVADGGSVWLLVTVQVLGFGFSMLIGIWISGLARANTERERLIVALEQAQASIARLSGEHATAAERARIARDLHDTIAQDLAGIAMLAQRGKPDLDSLRAIEQLAQGALAEVRGLVAAHGGVGLDAGLPVALERLGARFQAETGIAVTVSAAPVELPVDVEVALLRTAQEALANVRKHAAATGATVTMTTDASGVVLRVADDGRGFDRASLTRGLGLQGLDERMALAGGSLQIDSSPAGTTVTARLAEAGAA